MKNNNNNNTSSQPVDTENLILRMQKEDKRNKKIMMGMFFLYLIFSIFYTFLFIINPDPELTSNDRITGLSFVVAFIIGTIYFVWEYRNFKKVDYSLPLITILEKTEKRYRFFRTKWIPVIFIVAIVSFGITLSYVDQLVYWDVSLIGKILAIQGVYWAIMFIAGIIGYLIWRKRSRPIWKDAKTLLEELKN
jgi:predicted nucleic acid-binding Zn ribbon protein